MAEAAVPSAHDPRTPAGRLTLFVTNTDESLDRLLGELRRYVPAARPRWLVRACWALVALKLQALARLDRLARPTSRSTSARSHIPDPHFPG